MVQSECGPEQAGLEQERKEKGRKKDPLSKCVCVHLYVQVHTFVQVHTCIWKVLVDGRSLP